MKKKIFFFAIIILYFNSFSLTEFDADSILHIMKRVANYRMTYADIANLFNHTSAGKGDQPNPWAVTNKGNDWDVSSFFTGLMALYYATKDTTYKSFATRWANYFNWLPYNGVNTTNADNVCCTQTYTELYLLDPKPANNFMINNTKTCFTNYFDVVKSNPCYSRNNGWWWCDALYMAPPAIARYVKASNETRFLDSLDRYWWSVTKYLYDTTYNFYYRDDGFFPSKIKCPNGKPMFWSCGVAWAVAGLARVLEYMPKDYKNRAQWENQFKKMCAAIKAEQGFNSLYDGLWTTSMLDHQSYPDPETSGSAFFCFAMAWGVRNGLLDSATYMPSIRKAWRDLVKNIGPDGRLKRCQHVDYMPRENLSADINNSSPEGEGAFLLSGYQMYLFATTTTKATTNNNSKNKIRNDFLLKNNNLIISVKEPNNFLLKIFSHNGKLILDISSKIHLSKGQNTISLHDIRLNKGIYNIWIKDGEYNYTAQFININ